jgi:hypothetical protein
LKLQKLNSGLKNILEKYQLPNSHLNQIFPEFLDFLEFQKKLGERY